MHIGPVSPYLPRLTCLVKKRLSHFKLFYYMFMCGSLCLNDMNDVIYDTEETHKGQYGCMRGQIWVRARADMG